VPTYWLKISVNARAANNDDSACLVGLGCIVVALSSCLPFSSPMPCFEEEINGSEAEVNHKAENTRHTYPPRFFGRGGQPPVTVNSVPFVAEYGILRSSMLYRRKAHRQMVRDRASKNRLRRWGEAHPHAYVALFVTMGVCVQALVLYLLRVPFLFALLLIAADSAFLMVSLWRDVRNGNKTAS
jgi:hypothetical protein